MIQFLDLHKQYLSIKDEIDDAIGSVIREGAFIGGKYVNEFERNFADYQQVKHCVSVGNGTDAIEIAIEAMNLLPGSEIIVPANSFIASSEAVSRAGHKVVFCDVSVDDYSISIQDLRRRVTGNTSAIIAVHLHGRPCDMDSLLQIAQAHNLKIIEDCAQAHGAEYKGKRVGCIGDIGTFSFYPGKNLGAYGDGGAIVMNDDRLAVNCRMIANHGRVDKYDHQFEGRNSRLDGIQAAILSVKLRHLDQWIDRRRAIAQRYFERLSSIPGLSLPRTQAGGREVWHLFVVQTSARDELQNYLREKGVQTGIHYPIALPDLKAYDYLRQEGASFCASEMAGRIVSLPIGEHMTDADVDTVVVSVGEFFGVDI